MVNHLLYLSKKIELKRTEMVFINLIRQTIVPNTT